jgi:hypothetical protein
MTVLQLWEFTCKMWEHRNSILHNMQIEASQTMHNAENDDAITKPYEKVETYAAEGCWYFDFFWL